MKIRVFDTAAEMARAAAAEVAAVLRAKPDCVLGLATGSSPVGTYDELARMHREVGLSFACCTTVNLDEYLGLAPDHPQSYRFFMERHLFSRVDVDPARTFVPDGVAADPAAECARYDERLEALGGTDLQVLGIGPDGHVGFNEPADVFTAGTHVVDLDPSTIAANARFFADESEVPRRALTMGVGGIMRSRRPLLLASGEAKRAVLEKALRGPVTPRLPASVLQLHRDAVVFWSKS